MRGYKDSGVDVEKGERFVQRLLRRARRPGHDRLWTAAGGYAAVYPIGAERAIAVTTDGVGTKLLLAARTGQYQTIGIDLVAMCTNDLICVGARPVLFLDYFATGQLIDDVADRILEGIVAGCDQSGMILAGGETAEMPDMYDEDKFDLAGFALGELSRASLITGAEIESGNTIVGVASSGVHSNGLSLARKVLPEEKSVWDVLMIPTLIYVRPVLEIVEQFRDSLKGVAHITGGGWRNLFRLKERVGFSIQNPLPVLPVFDKIAVEVEQSEMYRTFNMGMGLCLIVSGEAERIVAVFADHGFEAREVGVVTDKAGELVIESAGIIIKE